MAKLPVLNLQNANVGEVELSEDFTGTEYHPYIIKDCVVAYMAEQRQGTHCVKTRSDVSGSTKKPWKQKGTGRARAGMIRSPLWRHGGAVFGPKPRDYSISINKKVRKNALKSAIAEKLRLGQVVVVDHLNLETPKTKTLAQSLKNLGCSKTLIVVNDLPENLWLASRNLAEVEVTNYHSLNVYKMLRYEKVIFAKEALTAIEQRLLS